jgi:hypothetical protein
MSVSVLIQHADWVAWRKLRADRVRADMRRRGRS